MWCNNLSSSVLIPTVKTSQKIPVNMTTSFQCPIRSLLNLSLQQLTNNNNLVSFKHQLWLLPPNLKDSIRTVLLKRGVALDGGIEMIKPLLHPNMRSLDLNECRKTEELLGAVSEYCAHL